MKRTNTDRSCVRAANSASSSSLVPRMMTQLILTGASPRAMAASMPRRTASTPGRRAIASNRSGRSVSSDTFTRARPASRSLGSWSSRSSPLVERATSSMPGMPAMAATRRCRSRRTSGSPPVSRIERTPAVAAAATIAAISSYERISSRCSQGSPVSGMQYTQRRLHLSVTETRRYVIGRLKPSVRPPRVRSTVVVIAGQSGVKMLSAIGTLKL